MSVVVRMKLSIFGCLLTFITSSLGFCGLKEVRCIDGTCVPHSALFDGKKDCPDGKYDEEALCSASQSLCATGRCMARVKFSNGFNDCGDNSDEVQFPCAPPMFSCLTTPLECINMSQVKDGRADCSDASDEVKYLGNKCDNECDGNCTCGRFVIGSTCIDERCACDVGYYKINKRKCEDRKLNDRCTTDLDCTAVLNHTTCHEGQCACTSGYIDDGTRKCRPLRLGDPCIANGSCKMFMNNSGCYDDICDCTSGYMQNYTTGECQKRSIQDPCIVDEDCEDAIDNSTCDNVTSSCTCVIGYYAAADMDFCVKRRLAESCVDEEDCSTVINNSTCAVDQKCRCTPALKPNDSLDTCINKMIGDTCEENADCNLITNSFCGNNVCTCISGYKSVENETRCERRTIFDPCDLDADCADAVNMSVCLTETYCACVQGYIEDRNDTLCRLRLIGDICNVTTDCDTYLQNSQCTNGSCECKIGFQSSEVFDACVLRRIGDDTCSLHEDCSAAVTQSECSNGTCICQSGYLAMANNTHCLKRNITSPCELNSDCADAVDNSTCSNGTCSCISGFQVSGNNSGCALRSLGDSCDVDADCGDAVPHSNCTYGACACNVGYKNVLNDSRCVLRNVGDACVVSDDCFQAVNYSLCLNDTCICQQGSKPTEENKKCVFNKVNDKCNEDLDCSLAVGNSTCDATSSMCECLLGFQENEDKNACVLRRIYDRTCTNNDDCTAAVGQSLCFIDQCLCQRGYYATEGNRTCTMFKIGDGNCSRDLRGPRDRDCETAVPKGECVSNVCQCETGYMAVENNTACQKRVVGDPCTEKEDCSKAVYDSVCMNDSCTCIDDYDATPDLLQCVTRPVHIGQDLCTFDAQCERLHNLSYCAGLLNFANFKACICPDGYFNRKDRVPTGECYVPEHIGDFCSNLIWCKRRLGDNTVCDQSVCGCRKGYLPNPNYDGCLPYPVKVDEFCRTDEHCVNIKEAQCYENRTCQCHYKFERSANNATCSPRPIRLLPDIPVQAIGLQCNIRTGRPCNRRAHGRKYMYCGSIPGRQHSRCLCVPGYANRWRNEELYCEDVNTYFFRINISLEIGCSAKDVKSGTPLCYMYQPIRVLRQYNNPKTKFYLDIREKIVLNGLGHMFEDTVLEDDFVNGEVINITEVSSGMQVSLLVFLASDPTHERIINGTFLHDVMIQSLIRSHGEIGKSQLKIVWPFYENLQYKDFDECTEQNNSYNDCSPQAWCLNTHTSYMCSCKYINVVDTSPDVENRPGRRCTEPPEDTTHSLSCSNPNCETQWEYIGLALFAFGGLLLSFIGYEIYARKRKMEKSDIYYKLQKATKKAKMNAVRERRKTIKRLKKDEKKNKSTKSKGKKGTEGDHTSSGQVNEAVGPDDDGELEETTEASETREDNAIEDGFGGEQLQDVTSPDPDLTSDAPGNDIELQMEDTEDDFDRQGDTANLVDQV